MTEAGGRPAKRPGALSGPSLGRVFVIGGTGMLRDACGAIAPRCESLVMAARRPQVLAEKIGATALVLDWSDRPAAADALPPMESRFDLAISWLHRDGLWLVPHLEARLRPGGRSIRIHSSAALADGALARIDPPAPPQVRRQRVLLGRRGTRWLTDAEISAGLLEAIATPERDVLIVGDAPRGVPEEPGR
ncbi:MAG: hypothetical protein D6801_09245 [Alphaproteobacteria bacterium]|nr:MAG: hypothetical protein D6801_09245 [Alphaproteobacteria bacterium]